jgi:hypothetical protein
MATSPWAHIHTVIELVAHLRPTTLLDIGKGFGKYGLLLHEYVGMDRLKRPNPNMTIADQSSIVIDAVECNTDYLWPHISQFYRKVFQGRIEHIYASLSGYDLVLLIDVIEHLSPEFGKELLLHFSGTGASVIVTTPRVFFQQDLFDSTAEQHVSLWAPREIGSLQLPFDYMAVEGSWVYLISEKHVTLKSFGHSWHRRLRRTAKVMRDELLHYRVNCAYRSAERV